MSRKERESPEVMDGSRRRRIAKGSGTQAEDVSRLIKGFMAARDMAKKMAGLSMGSKMSMARAMGGFDMSKLSAGGGMPRISAPLPKNAGMSPEQKRKLRDKRRKGK